MWILYFFSFYSNEVKALKKIVYFKYLALKWIVFFTTNVLKTLNSFFQRLEERRKDFFFLTNRDLAHFNRI